MKKVLVYPDKKKHHGFAVDRIYRHGVHKNTVELLSLESFYMISFIVSFMLFDTAYQKQKQNCALFLLISVSTFVRI